MTDGICLVRWVDSKSIDDWSEPTPCELAHIDTTGWIFDETETTLAIAGSRSACGQMCGIMVIPKVCIIDRVPLKMTESRPDAGEGK